MDIFDYVLIRRDRLSILADAADAGLMELSEGLADGTYEEDAIAGITADEIEDAITAARAVLK